MNQIIKFASYQFQGIAGRSNVQLAYSELDVHLSWFYNNPFLAFFAPFCGELFFCVFLPAGSVAGSTFRLPRR
jgi:hypothetical protein